MSTTNSRQRVQAEQGSTPGEKTIRPSIPRLVDAIRRIGHSPTDAILDICDNAVQANASKIDVFVSGQKTFDRIEVADSGKGMDEDLLTEALRLGSIVSYPSGSLSKYGLGLKSAALSQGRRLTILTRMDGGPLIKAVLDLDVIRQRDDYIVLFPPPSKEDEKHFEDRNGGIGTVIVIDQVDLDSAKGLTATINKAKRSVGEAYHRFITAADPVVFTINGQMIEAVDPLFVGDPLVEQILEPVPLEFEDANGNTVVVKVRATQLPHPPSHENRREIKDQYDIKLNNIGFYVYRVNRVIRRADTLDLFTRDTKLLSFRASIDFGTEADEFFGLDVAKRRITVAENVRGKLTEVFTPALNHSRKLWWDQSRRSVVPGKAGNGSAKDDEKPSPHRRASSQINAKDPLLATGRKERTTPQEKAQKASPKIKRINQPPKDKGRIIEVDELPDGLLWEPSLDRNGQVYVRINRGHPFFDKVYRPYAEEDPHLVEAVDYLLWALAHAEYNIGYDDESKVTMMEDLRRFASSNLRRLLAE